jgi:amidase
MDNIVGCIGPITRSARDLELFCKVMLDSEAWLIEPAVFEIPWRTEVAAGKTLPEKLCYAFLWDDGVVKPHPPIIRELERTKAALLAAGHEVIDWEPLDHQGGWDLISKLYFQDAGEEYRRTLAEGGEPLVPGTEWMLTHAPKQGYTVPETWKLNLEREQFRTRALEHWNRTHLRTSTGRPVDAIICPASSSLAVPHDGIRWWGYTSQWNILDLPSVVFPAHGSPRMDPAEWTGARMEGPRNEVERQIFEQWNGTGAAGCGDTYVGAPVALQIVGRRLNEEKVLAMLSAVEKATVEFYGESKTA